MSEVIQIPKKVHEQFKEVINGLSDCVVAQNDNDIAIFVHGLKDGRIQYKGEILTFAQLIFRLREEYEISPLEFFHVMVYCCYGFYQQPYLDDKNYIHSVYQNKSQLITEIFSNDTEYLCRISY